MKTTIMGSNHNWMKKIIIAASITLVPLAAAPSISHAQYIETDAALVDVLNEKHAVIDQYLFKDKVDELAKLGIHVTNTGPVGNIVEIGITEYTDDKAQYLYDVFGTDLVKVVDGEQAVTLSIPVGPDESTSSSPADDSSNVHITTTDALDEPILDADLIMETTAAEDSRLMAGAGAETSEAAGNSSWTPWVIALAAAILGGIALAARKLRQGGNR